jgi:hypothetical protein
MALQQQQQQLYPPMQFTDLHLRLAAGMPFQLFRLYATLLTKTLRFTPLPVTTCGGS